MTSRVPLTLDSSTNTIEELPAGDDLDLSSSNISNVANVSVTGTVTATGNISGSYILGNGSQLSGITTSPAGSNTQLQYNNNGAFGGISTVTYDGSNISLGNVGNVKITGGTANQYVQTDGSGNLSFATITTVTYTLAPCEIATTASITLSGHSTIDGITSTTNMRVLVKNQNFPSQNGVYLAQTGAWTRAPDFDTGAVSLQGGILVPVTRGTQNAGTLWQCTNTTAIIVGTTGITFDRQGIRGAVAVTIEGNIARNGNLSGTVAIGDNANAGSTNATSIGKDSLASSQFSTAVGERAKAIGFASVAYGVNSNSAGSASTVVGADAASTGNESTAIGKNTSSSGTGSIAIGINAASAGTNSIAIGNIAKSTHSNVVSIGTEAGSNAANTSGRAESINIGSRAGFNGQRANSISIGQNAGRENQGVNCIAIGGNAGYTNQANNSIVINATGANLENTTANSIVVKPIRAVTDVTGLKQLYYDPTTGELVYYNV